MAAVLSVREGDITTSDVDAVINAASTSLLGGGGVDGAIHRAAGPGLLAECREIGGCETGDAKITGGYNLKARHVIHTVGPIWRGGGGDEDALLANCYRRSIEVAADNGLATLAFPSVGTGAYGFPIFRATPIAVAAVREAVVVCFGISAVNFVCFSPKVAATFRAVLEP